jgi:hypothetical protein
MMFNSNQDLGTKLDINPKKLVIKYKISTIKAQMNSDMMWILLS